MRVPGCTKCTTSARSRSQQKSYESYKEAAVPVVEYPRLVTNTKKSKDDISLSEEEGETLPPAPEDEAVPEMGSVGHSRQLRLRLRAARKRLNLSHEEVAERVAKTLEIDSRTGASISHYEQFRRHPRIDVMAAWARAVGLRLIVDLDDARGKRIPVMLHPRTAELARVLDNASDEDFALARDVLYRILKVPPE
jgi:transcriptional regulator with XRE-family HTH domain